MRIASISLAFGTLTGICSYGAMASAQATPIRDVPADRPLVRAVPEPNFSVEGGAGVVGYIAGAAALGPAWQARITARLTPKWAVEANYLGAVNERNDNNDNMLTTQVDVSGRYNLLRANEAFVQPFITAGLGYGAFAGNDGDLFTVIVPVGGGVERMLTQNIKVGARLNYRPALFDDLETPEQRAEGEGSPGADTWTLLAHLGGAF